MTPVSRLLAGSLMTGLTVLCGAAFAQSAEPRLPIAELTRCDAGFFNALGAQAEALQALAPMRKRGSTAIFEVKPEGDHVPTVRFSRSVMVEGLEVVGFYDDNNGVPGMLDLHYWGFLVKGKPAEVAKRFKPLIWEASRLREGGPALVRSEVWTEKRPDDGFRAMVTANEEPPQPGTVERVLLIEEHDEQLTEFGCSLQSRKMPPAILKAIRPDLAG
ncbi:hypothetical protein ACNI65_23985 [Roseateles sp. So40a]|uniref:hypothetical protein n=1 Tax=Roseateles sp. So40a TaxID=3400226 RepID=UPI003A855BA9